MPSLPRAVVNKESARSSAIAWPIAQIWVELAANLLRAIVAQHVPGAAMGAGGGGGILPEAQFVLADDGAVALVAAVAGGAAAGRDPDISGARDMGCLRGRARGEQHEAGQ